MAVAYLKVLSLAVLIMAAVWMVSRISVKLYEKRRDPGE